MNRTHKSKYVKKKREREMSPHSRKCPHCSGEMKCRGASDVSGGISWKCKSKKCGRTSWERRHPRPPIPLAPKSYINR